MPSHPARFHAWIEGLRYGSPPWVRAGIITFLAVSDLAGAAAGYASPHDHPAAYAYANQLMPLTAWWTGFTIVGLLTLSRLRHPEHIRRVAYLGAFWGFFWTGYIVETVGRDDVTWRALTTPASAASAHLLLLLVGQRNLHQRAR